MKPSKRLHFADYFYFKEEKERNLPERESPSVRAPENTKLKDLDRTQLVNLVEFWIGVAKDGRDTGDDGGAVIGRRRNAITSSCIVEHCYPPSKLPNGIFSLLRIRLIDWSLKMLFYFILFYIAVFFRVLLSNFIPILEIYCEYSIDF